MLFAAAAPWSHPEPGSEMIRFILI